MPAVRRVGHRGADLLAPGNTRAAFAAAAQAGVDMLEFDILSEHRDGTGRLLLAHDYGDLARRPDAMTLDEGLEHLAGEAYAGLELDVDMKLGGYEQRVLDALRSAGLLERCLVTSMELPSLRVVRAIEPSVRLGLSVPRLRRDPMRRPWTAIPAVPLGLAYRALLPWRLGRLARASVIDAAMVHWRLVTPRLLRTMHRHGGELYVWTVDDRARVARLVALGVDGVITNDPRLFAR
jgi:glycerophosphoryl diester phosphodiesterase